MPELYFAGFDNRDDYWTVLREFLSQLKPFFLSFTQTPKEKPFQICKHMGGSSIARILQG